MLPQESFALTNLMKVTTSRENSCVARLRFSDLASISLNLAARQTFYKYYLQSLLFGMAFSAFHFCRHHPGFVAYHGRYDY